MTSFYRNIIFFSLLSIFYASYIEIDSSLVLNYNIDKKAVLIPNYDNISSNFKVEFLNKNRNFFIFCNLGYIVDNSFNINLSPLVKYKNFRFKANLDYLVNNQSEFYENNWNGIFDLLEKIEYLDLSIFNNKINFFIGEINNLTFGHGYLLNNYGNNHNTPIDKNLGLIFNFHNKNRSVEYSAFLSNLEDVINSSGLIGHHISLLFSESWPMRFGFGHVVDLDQFINYNDDFNLPIRQLNSFEFDFDFPLSESSFYKILFIGEISAIKLPESRYYKRVDDSQFTNDKKSRKGIWGVAFPGFKYTNDRYDFKLALNYNSAIYSPYYFNKTYDFEKIRYRIYNIESNESLYPDEENLLKMFESSDNQIFVPKDIYSMINGYENTHPTFGFSSSFGARINRKSKLNISYSYFRDLNNDSNPLSFNTILVDLFLKDYFFSIFTELDLYFSKNFFESSEFNTLNESMMYGANLSFKLFENLSLYSDYKVTFYDIDLDGSIDKINYINAGLEIHY